MTKAKRENTVEQIKKARAFVIASMAKKAAHHLSREQLEIDYLNVLNMAGPEVVRLEQFTKAQMELDLGVTK